MTALVLLLATAAHARVGDPSTAPGEVSEAELVGLVSAAMVGALKLVHALLVVRARAEGHPAGEAPLALRALGVPAAVGARDLSPADVFGVRAPRSPVVDRPADAGAADALARHLPDQSLPLLMELVVELYRGLLLQRGQGEVGPYGPLLLDGAREALLRRGAQEAVHHVEVGPARLVGAEAVDQQLRVRVELHALVDERWQGADRVRLRRDHLLLRRALAAPAPPHDEALAALRREGPGALVLPAELGGWIVQAFQAEDSVEPTPPAFDVGAADPAGRPPRGPDPDLPAQLRALAGRHPDTPAEVLVARVQALAAASLAARQPGAHLDPALEAALTARGRHLHRYWQRAAALLAGTDRPGFRPGACHVAAVAPLRVGLDPLCELVTLAIDVAGPPYPSPGAPHHHREVWTLARQVGTDLPWQVVDLAWAPAPIG